MKIKIACIGFMPEVIEEMPTITRVWDEVLNRVTGSDTEVSTLWLDPSYGDAYYSCKYPFFGVRNAFFIADRTLQAERDGYDGAALSAFSEWGVRQSLMVCNIPVTDGARAPIFSALHYGEKFAVLSNEKRLIPQQEVVLRTFGLTGFGINRPVRGGEWTLEELMRAYRDPEKVTKEVLIPKVEKIAKECIAEGADFLVTGCALLGPLLSYCNYTEVSGTGIPVIDNVTTAVVMAEGLARLRKTLGLKKSTHETSLYSSPPVELVDSFRKLYKPAAKEGISFKSTLPKKEGAFSKMPSGC